MLFCMAFMAVCAESATDVVVVDVAALATLVWLACWFTARELLKNWFARCVSVAALVRKALRARFATALLAKAELALAARCEANMLFAATVLETPIALKPARPNASKPPRALFVTNAAVVLNALFTAVESAKFDAAFDWLARLEARLLPHAR